MTDFNYEDRIKEIGLFNKWADFEGLDIKMSSETEHSSKETHLAFLARIAAKAQAVPDTHILIPKEPKNDTIIAIASVCLGPAGSEAQFLNLDEAKAVYQALVASESGAEQ